LQQAANILQMNFQWRVTGWQTFGVQLHNEHYFLNRLQSSGKKETLMRAFAVLIGPHNHHMLQVRFFCLFVCLFVKFWASEEQHGFFAEEITQKNGTLPLIRHSNENAKAA
jgi:hypothetical protein